MQRISSQEEDLAAGWHRSVPPGQWQLSRSAAAQVTSVTVRVEAACASSRQSWQMQVHAVITGARCKLNFLCILTREPGRLAVGKFDQLMEHLLSRNLQLLWRPRSKSQRRTSRSRPPAAGGGEASADHGGATLKFETTLNLY